MRHLLSLLLLTIFIPAISYGQQRFQLGLTGGFSSSYMTKQINVQQWGPQFGQQATIKGLFDFRWIQLGAGVEVGSIKGDIIRRVDATLGMYQYDDFLEKDAEITGLYKAPHAIVHLKINVTKHLYFFGGGMGGVMLGNSQLLRNNFIDWIYGANAGLVVNLGNRLALEVHEGWRRTEIGTLTEPRLAVVGIYGNYPFPSYYTGHALNYFTTNIGFRIRFGTNENRWYR